MTDKWRPEAKIGARTSATGATMKPVRTPPDAWQVAPEPRPESPSPANGSRTARPWRHVATALLLWATIEAVVAADAGRFDRITLLDPAFAPTIEVLAALALIGSWISGQRRWLTRRLPAVVLSAAAVTGTVAAVLRLTGTVTDPYPAWFALWVGMALAALIGLPTVAGRAGALRRGAAAAAVPLTLAGALLQINNEYGVWPTVGDLLGHTKVLGSAMLSNKTRGSSILLLPPGLAMSSRGVLVAVDPPAVASHFAHRPGGVYLPPAYFTPARAELPVIVMLPGAPGGTMQWPTSGKAVETANAYAAGHGGRAPILLFVDQNGSATADTECVDGPQGNAETYLTVDVPAFVTTTLRIPRAPSRWAVAGFSAGGTCAVDLALRHPDTFGHFVDLAGDMGPNLGDREQTRMTLFGGSRWAMDNHEPLRLLRTHRYRSGTGWFAAGIEDASRITVARRLAAAATKGGLIVHQFTGVAGHNWQFASDAFAQVLPALCTDLGLR